MDETQAHDARRKQTLFDAALTLLLERAGGSLTFTEADYQAVQESFGAYVSLRHQQHIELIPEHRETVTVGVLLTPRFDGSRPWDTTVAATKGDQHLDVEHREALERLWGSYSSGG